MDTFLVDFPDGFMALEAGTIDADSGMSKAIYDALHDNLKDGFLPDPPSTEVKDGWKKLSFCIATGVIEYIKTNMEINGIQTAGIIEDPANAVLVQNNDGTGHVQ